MIYLAIAVVAVVGAWMLWPIVRVELLLWRCARERRKRAIDDGFHWAEDGTLVDDDGEPWA